MSLIDFTGVARVLGKEVPQIDLYQHPDVTEIIRLGKSGRCIIY